MINNSVSFHRSDKAIQLYYIIYSIHTISLSSRTPSDENVDGLRLVNLTVL